MSSKKQDPFTASDGHHHKQAVDEDEDSNSAVPVFATNGNNHHRQNLGCGILGRYPIVSVVSFAIMGVIVGIGLSMWEPTNSETKQTVLKWVGIVGNLFIRALTAIVLPLVFVNVAVSVADMMLMGRAGGVAAKVILLYTLTTVIASTIGLISILSFQSLFQHEDEYIEDLNAYISLGCTEEGTLLTENSIDGSIRCLPNTNNNNETTSSSQYTQFEIRDLNAAFTTNTGGFVDLSVSDTIYEGVFMKLFTANIFHDFVDGNFAGVIVFAIVFGIALGRIIYEQRKEQDDESNITSNTKAAATTEGTIDDSGSGSLVVRFCREIGDVLLKMVNWVIACTPFAVLSLIAKAIGSQDDLTAAFSNCGYLVVACMVGFLVHFVLTDVGLLLLATNGKINPIKYLRNIIPAQTTAFACSSSAATLPVTLRCVKETGHVPDIVRDFVLPLGATINMDGTAIYYPCACIFLAYMNGITPDIGSYILLIILATIGSAGAAPVPSSGAVMIITTYNTVFGTTGIPNGVEYILAVDWFLDRVITALNVTGDTVICAVVATRTQWNNKDDDETSISNNESMSQPSDKLEADDDVVDEADEDSVLNKMENGKP